MREVRGDQSLRWPQSIWRLFGIPSPVNHLFAESEGPKRHVLRALLGAIPGAVFFIVLFHDRPLSFELRLSAGLLCSGVCAVGGACSSFFRCSLLLTFPMMLGSRGQTYVLLLLLSLLYSGPVQNIRQNVEASALSLSCNLDLQLNLSHLLWRQAVDPVSRLTHELMISTTDLGAETLNISSTFQTFRQEVMRQYGAEPLAADANQANDTLTTRTMMQCEDVVQGAVLRCSDWFNGKWAECLSTVSVPVLNQLLCFPMKFSFLCDIQRVMTPWCTQRLPVDTDSGRQWEQLNRTMDLFRKEFIASVQLQEEQQEVLDGPVLDQVFTDAVQDSLLRLSSGSEVLMELLQIAKSFTFISIIFQAVLYLVRFRSDLRFDNVYITEKFRHIETRRTRQRRRGVFPLSEMDQRNFIQPCSARIHPQEAPPLVSGLVQSVSVLVLVLVLVSLDLVLSQVLQIVGHNSITQLNITGFHQVQMEVVGDSLMARLLRKTVSVFNSSAHFDIDSSNRRCSVVPSSLPPSLYLKCCVCVLMMALFSLVQVYSSRLRRVICASFYPQREKMRVRFLYNVLLQSNRKCPISNRKCSSDRLVCSCCQTVDVQYQPT
ncbi:unnamed protein product [Knipowitschia caucasica]|uniref:Dendritic cell-specific transmembrane protein-like domain-containing protein n=1 Tax=Knipowitschia caucasica TaxID=637954 RepID=A0AAV2MFD6_KNICA